MIASSDLNLMHVVDDLAQIQRRVQALRLCAVAIELEGDKRSGQGLREIVEIVSADLKEVHDLLDSARGIQAKAEAA